MRHSDTKKLWEKKPDDFVQLGFTAQLGFIVTHTTDTHSVQVIARRDTIWIRLLKKKRRLCDPLLTKGG